jgi:hypothetical protein
VRRGSSITPQLLRERIVPPEFRISEPVVRAILIPGMWVLAGVDERREPRVGEGRYRRKRKEV